MFIAEAVILISMKKKLYKLVPFLLLLSGISIFFISCLTPPPAPRHHDNRRRDHDRQEQPAPRDYEPYKNNLIHTGCMELY
jgi:hypothetical protein